MIRAACAVFLIAFALPAFGAECSGNPDALGTARVLTVSPTLHPRVGRKSFPDTLGLAPKEVVLTFDDGPVAPTTEWVLETLRKECVRATFFLLGRNAAAAPAIARRIAASGHSVGTHTYAHRILSRIAYAEAEKDIERGIAAIANVVGPTPEIRTFFRFPGFASSPALLKLAEDKGLVVFGADLWASDWLPMTPEQELRLVMQRIEAARGGIVLLHDTRAQTAKMLPGLLRALKRGGYSVVHIVAAPAADSRRTEADPRWTGAAR